MSRRFVNISSGGIGYISITVLHLLLLWPFISIAGDPRSDSIQAYHQMEESPFDSNTFQSSLKLVNAAYESNPEEPWVYIAYSLATMQQGYRIGSWFRLKSFRSGYIEKALELAEKAKIYGESESQSYAHLARIKIIQKKYREAWDLLNQSYRLDNENFYAWFYRALIHYYMKGYEDAWTHLDEAQERVTERYQKKLVTRQRQRIARKQGNKVLEEQMYKRNIEDFPDNPYMYGNYASFLLANKRYKESVDFYEKAIAIKPYPRALSKLEEAKKKAGLN